MRMPRRLAAAPPEVRSLALLTLVAAAACSFSAAFPVAPGRPVTLLIVLTALATPTCGSRSTAGSSCPTPRRGPMRRRARARARRADLAVVLIDLDDFKAINDRDGHAAGDRLLVELARAWQHALRPADILARHGGDEFALLLPATSAGGAQHLVERLRAAHPMTWSAGIVDWPRGATLDSALALADDKLYEMKRRREDDGPAPRSPSTPPLPA